VQFNSDGVALGSPVPLNSGTATSGNVTALAAGTHSITAVYSGDSNYARKHGHGAPVGNAGGRRRDDHVKSVSVGIRTSSDIHGDDHSQYGLFKRRNGVKPRM